MNRFCMATWISHWTFVKAAGTPGFFLLRQFPRATFARSALPYADRSSRLFPAHGPEPRFGLGVTTRIAHAWDRTTTAASRSIGGQLNGRQPLSVSVLIQQV